jgi:hypothetical protein
MNTADPGDVARRLRQLGCSRSQSAGPRVDAFAHLCVEAQSQRHGRAELRVAGRRFWFTTLARAGLVAATLGVLLAPPSPADVQLGPSLGRGARLLLEHFTQDVNPMHR